MECTNCQIYTQFLNGFWSGLLLLKKLLLFFFLLLFHFEIYCEYFQKMNSINFLRCSLLNLKLPSIFRNKSSCFGNLLRYIRGACAFYWSFSPKAFISYIKFYVTLFHKLLLILVVYDFMKYCKCSIKRKHVCYNIILRWISGVFINTLTPTVILKKGNISTSHTEKMKILSIIYRFLWRSWLLEIKPCWWFRFLKKWKNMFQKPG